MVLQVNQLHVNRCWKQGMRQRFQPNNPTMTSHDHFHPPITMAFTGNNLPAEKHITLVYHSPDIDAAATLVAGTHVDLDPDQALRLRYLLFLPSSAPLILASRCKIDRHIMPFMCGTSQHYLTVASLMPLPPSHVPVCPLSCLHPHLFYPP